MYYSDFHLYNQILETANFIKREHLCTNLRVLPVLGPALDISSDVAKPLPAVITPPLGTTPPVTSDLTQVTWLGSPTCWSLNPGPLGMNRNALLDHGYWTCFVLLILVIKWRIKD